MTNDVKTPWHLWVIALVFLFIYVNGVYDYFMMLGHNVDYYESKGFTEQTHKYFTDYPTMPLIFWTTNIICGVISPILLIFRLKLTVWVAFISAMAMSLLELSGFIFMNRWEALGTYISLFDIGLLILTWGFFFYCKHLKNKKSAEVDMTAYNPFQMHVRGLYYKLADIYCDGFKCN